MRGVPSRERDRSDHLTAVDTHFTTVHRLQQDFRTTGTSLRAQSRQEKHELSICIAVILLAKDIVTRYAHQTGHHVERRFGWDCHGLPVEYEIDKTLGITVDPRLTVTFLVKK